MLQTIGKNEYTFCKGIKWEYTIISIRFWSPMSKDYSPSILFFNSCIIFYSNWRTFSSSFYLFIIHYNLFSNTSSCRSIKCTYLFWPNWLNFVRNHLNFIGYLFSFILVPLQWFYIYICLCSNSFNLISIIYFPFYV